MIFFSLLLSALWSMRRHSAESLLDERLWLNLHRWQGKRKWKHHNLSMSVWRGKMGNLSLIRLQSRDLLCKENWKIFTRAKREWNEGESCQWSACHHESAETSRFIALSQNVRRRGGNGEAICALDGEDLSRRENRKREEKKLLSFILSSTGQFRSLHTNWKWKENKTKLNCIITIKFGWNRLGAGPSGDGREVASDWSLNSYESSS